MEEAERLCDPGAVIDSGRIISGLWLPIPSMPPVLRHISHATPLGAAWEAFQNADLGHWPPALALVTMAAWAIATGAAVARYFRRE